MTNRLKQERILAVILCILVVIPSLFFLTRKNLFHVDEIWTYALSNSTEGPYLYLWQSGIGDPNDREKIASENYSYSGTDSGYFLKWHSGDEYNRYLTVQKEERFDYANVFYNQSCDVHPPLYYLLIHTICSFFPNRFSKWFAAIPNLIFMAGCAYFLYRLTLQLGLKRERAVLVVLLWGCSRAGISDAVFLRMYMMLTFWALLSMYIHTKLLVDPGKHILLLFFVNLAGFLTQYYYYVFCFFLTLVFCITFAFKRRFKLMVSYSLSVLSAVAVAIATFPAIIRHVFHGAYTETSGIGGESFIEMLDWINIIFEDYIGINLSENASLFWVLWPIISTFLFAMVLILLLRRNTNPVTLKDVLDDFIHKRPSVYWMLMIATVATSCVLSMVSPSMPGFQDRYHFFMLPVLSIFIADTISLCLWLVSKTLKLRNRLRICLPACIIVMIISSNLLSDNSYTNYSNDQTSPHAVLDH